MKTALFCFVMLFALSAFGQVGKQLTVISTSGLNLRSKPNLQSKVIKTLPWGAKVRVAEVVNKEKVELGIQHITDLDSDGEADTVLLVGRWVKANYGKLSGYLFDAYLLDLSDQIHSPLPDYALLFEGYDCLFNLNFDLAWNWYGVYDSDGGAYLKVVSISCLKETEEEYGFGDFLGIFTKESTEAKFIFGTKKPLDKNKFRQSEGAYPMNFYSVKELAETQPIVRKVGLELAVVKRKNIDNQTIERYIMYALGSDGQRQSLELADDNQGEWTLSELVWAGDLDGDGKNDYIVYYGEVSAVTILYLSSIAPKGQIVKEAARWYSGYCC